MLCSGTYGKCKNMMACLFLEKWETTVGVKSSYVFFFSPYPQLFVDSGLEEKTKKANKILKKSLNFGGYFCRTW